MALQMIDLRDLLKMINEKKDLKAQLSLEFDCKIDLEDIQPLIKVLNYITNYLTTNKSDVIYISLNAGGIGFIVSFTANTTKTDLPPVSEQIQETLNQYNAVIEVGHVQGSYIKFLITFKH